MRTSGKWKIELHKSCWQISKWILIKRKMVFLRKTKGNNQVNLWSVFLKVICKFVNELNLFLSKSKNIRTYFQLVLWQTSQSSSISYYNFSFVINFLSLPFKKSCKARNEPSQVGVSFRKMYIKECDKFIRNFHKVLKF